MYCKYKHTVHRYTPVHIICCKDINYLLQRQQMHVAKTKCICCKDKIYMLQRQIYMLYKQNLYVIKTKFICCRDKKLGARAERARRGFFSPKERHSYFLRTQYSCFVLETDKIPLKSTVLGLYQR